MEEYKGPYVFDIVYTKIYGGDWTYVVANSPNYVNLKPRKAYANVSF
jgi:hypothetical protein